MTLRINGWVIRTCVVASPARQSVDLSDE
jgi:hypothetical protein